MDHLVLTVIATDHPGLVERIAQCIASHGGNWLESRMSRMAGQFAGILRVAVPAEGYDELVEGLQGLSSTAFACSWRKAGSSRYATGSLSTSTWWATTAPVSCATSPGCWPSTG